MARARSAGPVASRFIAGAIAAWLFNALVAEAQTVRRDFYSTDGSVNAVVFSGNTLYIGGQFSLVGPATGGGVPIDGGSGIPVVGFPPVTGVVWAAASDGSGGWYIGGNFTAVGGIARKNVAHILADNSVSPWNPDANGLVFAFATSGATVYVGGNFSTVGGQSRRGIAALDAGTGVATSWNPGSSAGSGGVRALAVAGTTIYAGGSFTSIGGQLRNYIAALDASTGLATSWNPNPPTGPVAALAVVGATVYAGGAFLSIGGQVRHNIAALDSATGLATAFNPNANSSVAALAASGTAVYAGGFFTVIGGQPRNGIAALNSTTGLATSWTTALAGTEVRALVVGGGKVYAGGNFSGMGGEARRSVAALDVNTGFATAWNPSPRGPVYALAASGTTVYVGGEFNGIGEWQQRNNIAALDATTGQVTAWNPNADNPVEALAATGATIYAAGSFSNIGGQLRSFIAALDSTTGLATGWDPNADGPVSALAVRGATVYAAGPGFRSIGGQSRFTIAALDAGSGLATDWDPNPVGAVLALASGGPTIYAGGPFTSIGGQTRMGVAALDSATGLATAWNPNADQAIGSANSVLALDGNTLYVVGGFLSIGGQPRTLMAALDATTGLATAWDPAPDGQVDCLAVSGNTIYAGGEFTSIGGQARNHIASLDLTTGAATIWNSDAGDVVRGLAVGNGQVFAGGNFFSFGKLPLYGLAAMEDLTTPTLLSLVSAHAAPDHVHLTWFSAGGHDLTAMVYRRTATADWSALGQISADGTGKIIYDDTDASAGARYGYRLGVMEGGREVFYGEAWVDVPRALEFALSGPHPNPTSRDFTISLSLPNASPARLEVLDLAGRMLIARDVGGLGAGNHVLTIPECRTLAPGVYLLRLTRENRSLTARAVIVR